MIPTIASGRGYCLQTAHLESRCLGSFARNLAGLPNYREREGWQPHQLQPHSTPPYAGVTPLLNSPVLLVYTGWKLLDIQQ